MEVKRLFRPHGYPKQSAQELEVADVLGRSAGGVEGIAVCVEPNLAGRVGRRYQQLYGPIFQFLKEDRDINNELPLQKSISSGREVK